MPMEAVSNPVGGLVTKVRDIFCKHRKIYVIWDE